MKIKSLRARPVLDSRGEWTLEVSLQLENGARATAAVPQGKSTGSHEANALPADAAVRRIQNAIAPRLLRQTIGDQSHLDRFLNELDGTPDKSRLGANAMLGVSIAFARAISAARGVPLWKYIREAYGAPAPHSRETTHPRLFMNLINGGVHSGSNLAFQEYLVIPKCPTFREAVRVGVAINRTLGEFLEQRKGKQATNLGDEGGFAPCFEDELEPIRVLRAVAKRAAKEMKFRRRIDFGIDAAASEIKKSKRDKLTRTYAVLARDERFIYLEDPFGEDDFGAFSSCTARFGRKIWIAGDDLTVTNLRRMERAHAERSINAVIIKPNQIGTVTEALDAVRAARRYGWAVIASHRSGETNDDFIVDFAYGVGAEGLKLGAPARGERVAKYNRLLEIESGEGR